MKTYGKATLYDGLWTIEAEPHVLMVAKRVFRSANSDRPGRFSVSHGKETARDLEWFCDRYPLEVDPKDAMLEAAARHRETIKTVEDYLTGHRAPEPFDLAIPPRGYQAQAASLLLATGSLLLADDLGLGKTCSAIATFCDARTLPALVVAPAHLTRQWAREIARFAPTLTVHELKKGTPYDLPDFFGKGPDVLITTYHKLFGWAQVLARYCKSIVFDEAHELRRSDSNKYRAAQSLTDAIPLKLGLSATPVFNYGDDVFNIVSCLRPGSLGTHGEFRAAWCKPGEGGVLKDSKALGTFLRENGLLLRRTRKEVSAELPALTRVVEEVASDPEALAAVDDIASKLASMILGQTPVSKQDRFLASGELDWRLRQATGLAKAPHVAAFAAMIAETGEKLLLVGWHHAVYDVWDSRLEAAGVKVAKYTGEQNASQKDAAIKSFVEGDAQVFMLSLRAGAGIDGLQGAASIVVFGELDWSPAVHDQVIGRLHRHGQEDPVVAYYLVSEEGSDPVIGSVLGLKRLQADGIRDPLGQDPSADSGSKDHIRRLAESYLTLQQPIKSKSS